MAGNSTLKEIADSLPTRSEIMKALGDFAASLPSREAIARAAGVPVRTPAEQFYSSLGIFVGGAVFGAAMVMLLAPRSTHELRDQIGERASELGSRAAEIGRNAASHVADLRSQPA